MPPRRCISCGTLAPRTRCQDCQRAWDRQRNARRPHYQDGYAARRNAAVAYWHAIGAHCHLCGEPLEPERRWPDPRSTTADHLTPGDPDSELAPAHARCNSSRGARPLK